MLASEKACHSLLRHRGMGGVGWEAQDRDHSLSSGNLEMFATTFEANFFHLFLCWARYDMGDILRVAYCRTVVLSLWVTTSWGGRSNDPFTGVA